jgi:hypothetical protein
MRVNVVRLRSGGKTLPRELITKAAAGVDGHLFFMNGLASLHEIDDPDTQWVFPALRDATVIRVQNELLLIDGTETVLVPGAETGALATVTQYRQTWQCMALRRTTE